LLGANVVRYPSVSYRLGDTPSDFALAFGTSYQDTGAGVLRNPVLARGGVELGWSSGPFVSISFLPRGAGGYLIFGGAIVDEAPVAGDLARLLMGGAVYAAQSIDSRQVALPAAPGSLVIDWTVPFASPNDGIMLVAFDPNPDGIFLARLTL
jgi:hypothetical protein